MKDKTNLEMKEKVPHQLGPQTYHCKQNSVYSFKNKLKYTFKYIIFEVFDTYKRIYVMYTLSYDA